jgi:chromosome segregation ATPase
VAAKLEAFQGQVANVSGNVLVVSESLEKLTADVVALKRQQKGSKQQPASATGDSSRVSALEAELAEHRQQLEQLGAQLAEARSMAAATQQVLTAAGLTQEADARDMQDVLNNAAQTHVESQQLRDELKQMQLLFKELEARSNEHGGHIPSTRASLGQLQQQVAPRAHKCNSLPGPQRSGAQTR